MIQEQEMDNLKIKLLDYYCAREGLDCIFFHDLETNIVYSPDKKTPLFEGLDGIVGTYNISSGYLRN
jgi:hypothetical protein